MKVISVNAIPFLKIMVIKKDKLVLFRNMFLICFVLGGQQIKSILYSFFDNHIMMWFFK